MFTKKIRRGGPTRLIIGGFLALGGGTTLLLRGSSLAINYLLLGGTLTKCLLGGISTLLTVLILRGSSLLLGSGLGRGTVGVELELAANLGPGVGGGTRVAHSGEGSQLLVVNLEYLNVLSYMPSALCNTS
jgi:hypothetical protein